MRRRHGRRVLAPHESITSPPPPPPTGDAAAGGVSVVDAVGELASCPLYSSSSACGGINASFGQYPLSYTLKVSS